MSTERAAPLRRIMKYAPKGGRYKETNNFDWLFGEYYVREFLKAYIDEFKSNLKQICKENKDYLVVEPHVEFHFAAVNHDPDTKFHSKLILERKSRNINPDNCSTISITRSGLIIPHNLDGDSYTVIDSFTAKISFYGSCTPFVADEIARDIVFKPYLRCLFKRSLGRTSLALAKAYILAQPHNFSLTDIIDEFVKKYDFRQTSIVIDAFQDLCSERKIVIVDNDGKPYRITN